MWLAWLMAVPVLALATPSKTNIVCVQFKSNDDIFWRVCRRVYGVGLASQIRPGMRAVDAHKIIGTLRPDQVQYNPQGISWCYDRYGFSLWVELDNKGEWRVIHRNILPLSFWLNR